ncbi:nuclear transport factor 2 family protein [Belnapia sp. T6]|uniref:Nuclear transport factor 2 family protein n=1 Tax=Belnapia mucosa TaxID=2804532 RepID=A0ABS1V9R5_9PROT|nr:nuclear transport factor 2 family protein [Belnapia mucosa]MBL6458398.1 nuclear transport factor 2 family protein [Belnapia mucosa]
MTTDTAFHAAERVVELTHAVQRYFDLMYDCDTSRFDQVFRSTVQLHGFRGGQMLMWSASAYRGILDNRQSPKSANAPRCDEILLMDFASDSMALVKLRLRVGPAVYVDYLTWHRIDGEWLITSKGYHIEAEGTAIRRESGGHAGP